MSPASPERRRQLALRRRLLAWYHGNRRDLPWRHSRDPYAIWISESMLQQTRVETVIPYYQRFLARFPDVQTLADAPLDDVLAEWTGLGYYSRARNLHAAARCLIERHGGEVPDDPEALRALPGVGRYTAGAVASIAFDRPEAVVDGNVTRVLARLYGLRENAKSPAMIRRLWELAGELARGPEPGALNQALMELGATLCTPRAPQCPRCPLRGRCVARRDGDPEALPVKTRRAARTPLAAVAGWIPRRGRVLAVKRPSAGLLGGLWDLPGGELVDGESPPQALQRCLLEGVGLRVDSLEPLGEVQQAFTHRDLTLQVFRCGSPQGRVRLRGFEAHRWLAPRSFLRLPQGRATRAALELATPGGAES
ncbi:MAG: A/G-specific adenine glycosylase [Myxococcales bacterium]|nr:A/G-specific adenine glycosylase [Myxococcales bacterium]